MTEADRIRQKYVGRKITSANRLNMKKRPGDLGRTTFPAGTVFEIVDVRISGRQVHYQLKAPSGTLVWVGSSFRYTNLED